MGKLIFALLLVALSPTPSLTAIGCEGTGFGRDRHTLQGEELDTLVAEKARARAALTRRYEAGEFGALNSIEATKNLHAAVKALDEEFFRRARGELRFLPKSLRRADNPEHTAPPESLTPENMADEITEGYFFDAPRLGVPLLQDVYLGVVEFVGHGSGFLVGGGVVITAAHVAARLSPEDEVQLRDAAGNVRIVHRLTSIQPHQPTSGADVTAIKIPALAGLAGLPLAALPAVTDERVFAFGTPVSTGRQVAVTGGVLATDGLAIFADCEVRGGMSGGPLVNGRGEVIGSLWMQSIPGAAFIAQARFVPLAEIRALIK